MKGDICKCQKITEIEVFWEFKEILWVWRDSVKLVLNWEILKIC